MKFNGRFDEVQKELKHEIAHQYIAHHVTMAKEKARNEFSVIESGRYLTIVNQNAHFIDLSHLPIYLYLSICLSIDLYLLSMMIFLLLYLLVRRNVEGMGREVLHLIEHYDIGADECR
jgi:hypothetical protein